MSRVSGVISFSFLSLSLSLSLSLLNAAPEVCCHKKYKGKGLNIAVSPNKSFCLFPVEHYARTVQTYTNGLNIAVSPNTSWLSLFFLSLSLSLWLSLSLCSMWHRQCAVKKYTKARA